MGNSMHQFVRVLREALQDLSAHTQNFLPTVVDEAGICTKLSNDAESIFGFRTFSWAVNVRLEKVICVKNVGRELRYDEKTFSYRQTYEMVHRKYTKMLCLFDQAWYIAMAQKFRGEAGRVEWHLKLPIKGVSGGYFVVKRKTKVEQVDAVGNPIALIHHFTYEKEFDPIGPPMRFEICVLDKDGRRVDIEAEVKRIARLEILKVLGFRAIENQKMFKTMRLHLSQTTLPNGALAQALGVKPAAVKRTIERVFDKLADYYGWVGDVTAREIAEVLDDLGLLPPEAPKASRIVQGSNVSDLKQEETFVPRMLPPVVEAVQEQNSSPPPVRNANASAVSRIDAGFQTEIQTDPEPVYAVWLKKCQTEEEVFRLARYFPNRNIEPVELADDRGYWAVIFATNNLKSESIEEKKDLLRHPKDCAKMGLVPKVIDLNHPN